MSKKNIKVSNKDNETDESSEEEFDITKLSEQHDENKPDEPNTTEEVQPKLTKIKVKGQKGKRSVPQARMPCQAVKRTVPVDYATNKALSMSVKELSENLISLGKKYETLESRYEQMRNSEETKTAADVKKAAMDARLYFQNLAKR